jgi:HD superfamily phosphohydrolase
MAEYYKYVARDADSQINYAEVGQQAVDMLQNFNETREAKKEAYREAARESINNLMEAPQGKDQVANDFISKYAQKMIDQKMVNKNLFERGLMSERDYTLSMQNQMDGTKRLFNLQKLYQQEFETTMQGINDKKLQSGLTIFNQSTVEGAANFNNSEAFIDPKDGTVSVGLMENKVVDGKLVKVLNPNTAASAAVWTGRIMQKPAYFDVDGKTTDFVKNLGDLKDAVYSAASTSRAGTITELTGIEFLKTNIKDPATRAIVNNFNDALNFEAESYLSPLNVASILTDDLRKYDSKSFTFDRAEADSNPKKILATIDPVTQMTTLDESGKYYKQQYDEAKNFIKIKILSKMDNDRKISTTSQLSESAEAREAAARRNRAPSGEAPPPVFLAATQRVKGVDKNGKPVDGVTSGLENLSIKEAKGVENHATAIGWNRINGALELKGYQASGREEEGKTIPGEKGIVGKKGESGVRQKNFVSSDKKNSRLLSLFITKIPNPEDPEGGNFRNITQARDYYKREYERVSGRTTPAPSAAPVNRPPVIQNGVTYNWNPNTNQYE